MSDRPNSRCTAIFYERGSLRILDQLLLPEKTEFISISGPRDAFEAIQKMQVRGAPAIAIVAVLSIAVELENDRRSDGEAGDKTAKHRWIASSSEYLASSRPTAVNLKNAVRHIESLSAGLLEDSDVSAADHKRRIIEAAETLFRQDVETNKKLATYGADSILESWPADEKVTILTVCNTGSLATAGYGTALGVIRKLHEYGRLETAFYTETRPYNQGERLTAYELAAEAIPAVMICDNMVSHLMRTRKIHAVVVGADRVAVNGDTANKIGTYQAAIAASYHKVPFLVACPSTTVDVDSGNGSSFPMEVRSSSEVSLRVQTPIWNPAFDFTPNELVTAIVTEHGVFSPRSPEWRDFTERIAAR